MPPAASVEAGPQFLVAGHVVQDLLSEDGSRWRLGGAAAYASLLARNLGFRTAVLTAAAPDVALQELLPGIELRIVDSPATTCFRNVYGPDTRRQFIPQRAAPLTASDLPGAWRDTPIVLLGPVAGEIDDSLARAFGPDSLVGVGAQGWLRETGPDAAVRPVHPSDWRWEPVLGAARALFLSDEDLPLEDAPAALAEWSTHVDVLAFTRGYGGADVCYRGEWRRIAAFPAQPVDLTGAGDIFATGFLARFYETGDAWEAARFASCAASFVVEGEGVGGMPQRAQIEERLARYPEVSAR